MSDLICLCRARVVFVYVGFGVYVSLSVYIQNSRTEYWLGPGLYRVSSPPVTVSLFLIKKMPLAPNSWPES